jgi:hypothetical protein
MNDDLPPLPECSGLAGYTDNQMRAYARAALAARGEPEGDIVVTKTPDGQIVAVTRQDDEGRILSVIAESTVRGEPMLPPQTPMPADIAAIVEKP